MNEGQIIEIFIRAAEVDRKLPDTARPAISRVSPTAPKNDIPYLKVSRMLKCDPDLGKLYWRRRTIKLFNDGGAMETWNKKFVGKEAFTHRDANGYLCGGILGRRYRAHRIIWLLHYKKWPDQVIDHINGDPSDNRIINLRDVSQAENMLNTPRSRGELTIGGSR